MSTLSDNLYRQGIVESPRLFAYYAFFTRQSAKIKAGEYYFEKGLTSRTLLAKLVMGDVIKRQVTFQEGLTFNQMLDELLKHSEITLTLKNKSERDMLKKIGVKENNAEGYFFPDTYSYQQGSTDVDILKLAYQKMQTVLNEEWAARAPNLPYQSSYEALIMASIVEKETGAASERASIAGLFLRRLQKGMLLQTDPSVIYGLGSAYSGNLTRAHLEQDSPYNTYMRKGLPPTPIANPGREAIHAALHPADTKALYFVGKGDGTHYFSQTLAEHNAAVQKYQVSGRSQNYRSAVDKAIK